MLRGGGEGGKGAQERGGPGSLWEVGKFYKVGFRLFFLLGVMQFITKTTVRVNQAHGKTQNNVIMISNVTKLQ